MVTNKTASKQDEQEIIELWDRSVTATHDFLTQEDKETMREEIPGLFQFVDLRLWYDEDRLVGFSGRKENSLEMLFIEPKYMGQGYGTAILQELVSHYGITLVDVNEQNPAGKKFYFKNGFRIYDRSSVDGQNRPYPLLHLTNS
ncbi:GNAT family N-acetyltransferase [Tetragenococcus halophilus]|uniref:GNAT family N-acetyltransferase n=1 Tax=Tetragenococcus halophilus TaxID=51669 RepID=UPI00077C863B|nr:GNAT family N-acetyltransferase [Tetragenococcus halophilus]